MCVSREKKEKKTHTSNVTNGSFTVLVMTKRVFIENYMPNYANLT